MAEQVSGAGFALPRPTRPEELIVVPKAASQAGARLLVLPSPAAVQRILTEYFGWDGWSCRHYACGGVLYCGIGVRLGADGERIYRDAPALDDYGPLNRPAAAAASSLYHAAAMWGVCADIKALPPIWLPADQVRVAAVPKADGKTIDHWRLDQALKVDQLGTADGEITMIQFAADDGRKIVWRAT